MSNSIPQSDSEQSLSEALTNPNKDIIYEIVFGGHLTQGWVNGVAVPILVQGGNSRIPTWDELTDFLGWMVAFLDTHTPQEIAGLNQRHARAMADRERQLDELKRKRGSTRVQRNGYVYLIQSDRGYYKIGRTANPSDRAITFSALLPFEIEFICLIPTGDMVSLETALHRRFADKRVNGEWFDLAPEDVEYIRGLAQ